MIYVYKCGRLTTFSQHEDEQRCEMENLERREPAFIKSRARLAGEWRQP